MELSFLGEYTWNDKDLEKEAIKANLNKKPSPAWFPDKNAFFQIANQGHLESKIPTNKNKGGPYIMDTSSFLQICVKIVQSSKPIERINVFTHGFGTLIGFRGQILRNHIEAIGIYYDPKHNVNVPSGISVDILEKYEDTELRDPTGKLKGPFKFKDVRSHFEKNKSRLKKESFMVLYACNSALDSELLQEIANTFGLIVYGFKDLIRYDIVGEGTKIHSMTIGIGQKEQKPESFKDFHSIDHTQSDICSKKVPVIKK
jgi:hypothetical protein